MSSFIALERDPKFSGCTHPTVFTQSDSPRTESSCFPFDPWLLTAIEATAATAATRRRFGHAMHRGLGGRRKRERETDKRERERRERERVREGEREHGPRTVCTRTGQGKCKAHREGESAKY